MFGDSLSNLLKGEVGFFLEGFFLAVQAFGEVCQQLEHHPRKIPDTKINLGRLENNWFMLKFNLPSHVVPVLFCLCL
jgi:hypothetical protein